MAHTRFCVVLDASRPLLELEYKFFNKKRGGNVPVIAVFTKFDDLIVQVYDWDREEESRPDACKVVKEKFETPLEKTVDRPRAYPLMMMKAIIKSKLANWKLSVKELVYWAVGWFSHCYTSNEYETQPQLDKLLDLNRLQLRQVDVLVLDNREVYYTITISFTENFG
ncbi:hypothetical protein HYPSUDRAFT_56554 [Hypholoma sublateritium FD-334 SS-4]|uniref:Uncharacterized protein n=1 Tax=Hypholoma sublateritium (strain FD-334 SS-4) TaxID=945553 RepID=A0A0D2KYJ2_HYPSF|nr:hypothetical protein HYPSUDRAFT_56554 [Hypholoma sublateritium FD-334 SS-4]